MEYLRRVAHADTLGTPVRDYYLSALLLDRQVVDFETELVAMYGNYSPDSLPKHYREALILLAEFSDDFELVLESDTLFTQFERLKDVERQYDDALVRNNYVRKEFGRTYWWYYLYGR